MNRNVLVLIGIVILVLTVIGSYYGHSMYSENKYYEDYRLQSYYGEKAIDIRTKTMNSLSSMSISQFDSSADNMTSDLDKAKGHLSQASSYEQEMLKYADSDYEKKYAENLINYNNEVMKVIDLTKEIIIAMKNRDFNKINELKKQLDEVNKHIDQFKNDREDIRAKNPDFTSRLDKEHETAMNATIN